MVDGHQSDATCRHLIDLVLNDSSQSPRSSIRRFRSTRVAEANIAAMDERRAIKTLLRP